MAYTGPAANVANWIKNGSTTATYSAQNVTVPVGAVSLASGTIIKNTNYSDDVRDFLVGVLDSVAYVYAAQTLTAIPSTFSVTRVIGSSQVQYLVTVSTNGDVDFPTLA